MATITKTYTDDEYASASYKKTWSVTYAFGDITITGNTFQFVTPTITAKFTGSTHIYRYARIVCSDNYFKIGSVPVASGGCWIWETPNSRSKSKGASGSTFTIGKVTGSAYDLLYAGTPQAHTKTLTTSDFFNSGNKTTKTLNVQSNFWIQLQTGNDTTGNFDSSYDGYQQKYIVGTVTLNAPPIVENVAAIYSTPQYQGLGTYTVSIASALAQYGGDITSITLKVGSQTETKTYTDATSVSDDTISLVPSVAGTFTPTVTVTDSRGQTTTVNLSPITVNAYNAPAVDFGVFRTNASGVSDDEGHYALATTNMTYTGAIANLTAPSVSINGTPLADYYAKTLDTSVVSGKTYYAYNGSTYEVVSSPVDAHLDLYYEKASVTWYSTYSQSGVSSAISDWTQVGSNNTATVYGLINACFAESESYQITISETDSLNTASTLITQTLSTAFYTVDFKAGGKEIAFGAPANDDLTDVDGIDCSDKGLFKCNMDALFRDRNDVVRLLFDFVYPVGSYYETSKSQAEFDPNDVWGGTWELELAGQVHVSSGTGYSVSGAETNTSDGGSKYLQAHTHSDNFTLPNHTHGTGGTASEGTDRFMTMGSGDGWGASRRTIKNGTGTSLAGNFYNEGHPMTRKANTGNPNSNSSISGSVGAVSGVTTGSGENMPPYIVVNRWHRTA